MSEQQRKLKLGNVSAAELAPLEALFDAKYPERLREIATCVFLELKSVDRDMPPEELAMSLTEALSTELGGGNFYLHKGVSYRLSLRDRQIAAEFTGNNQHLLARKWNLSEMRISQILAAVQEERFLARQHGLPGVADWPEPERTVRQPTAAASKGRRKS